MQCFELALAPLPPPPPSFSFLPLSQASGQVLAVVPHRAKERPGGRGCDRHARRGEPCVASELQRRGQAPGRGVAGAHGHLHLQKGEHGWGRGAA